MLRKNIKRIFLYILIIIVSFIVMTALYFNRYKFDGINIVKYVRVNLEDETSLDELAKKYSTEESRIKFVSEIKRINNLNSSEYIPGNSTLIIPIIESE